MLRLMSDWKNCQVAVCGRSEIALVEEFHEYLSEVGTCALTDLVSPIPSNC